jgi:hypothetical protein
LEQLCVSAPHRLDRFQQINNKLLTTESPSSETLALIHRWGQLHVGRPLLALAALAVYCAAALGIK